MEWLELAEYTEEVQIEAMFRNAWIEGWWEAYWAYWIHGVRTWVEDGCNEYTKNVVAQTVDLTLEQFDEILTIILEHPEYDDKDVIELLDWNPEDHMDADDVDAMNKAYEKWKWTH